MQIDFHHTVTYVAARLAGFAHNEADIIAYAAQYVDDATCDGAIRFDNNAIYKRISSAHKTIDVENIDPVEDLLVWMPFHFLPGNGGVGRDKNPDGSFIRKIVTHPNSPIAKEMVQTAIQDNKKPYSLHRLGITMHVYADTWAHQGFAGVKHEINNVRNFDETGNTNVFEGGLNDFINHIVEKAVPPLGHAKANVFPDMPFLSWRYTNGLNEQVERNNTDLFCDAANALCKAMQDYRKQTDPAVQLTGINAADMGKIRKLFVSQQSKDGNERHKAWLKAIEENTFSFGSATISYCDDGPGSWKGQALGTSRDLLTYQYKESFLTSNWKMFHDALQLHRIIVSHDILPKYRICAA